MDKKPSRGTDTIKLTLPISLYLISMVTKTKNKTNQLSLYINYHTHLRLF